MTMYQEENGHLTRCFDIDLNRLKHALPNESRKLPTAFYYAKEVAEELKNILRLYPDLIISPNGAEEIRTIIDYLMTLPNRPPDLILQADKRNHHRLIKIKDHAPIYSSLCRSNIYHRNSYLRELVTFLRTAIIQAEELRQIDLVELATTIRNIESNKNLHGESQLQLQNLIQLLNEREFLRALTKLSEISFLGALPDSQVSSIKSAINALRQVTNRTRRGSPKSNKPRGRTVGDLIVSGPNSIPGARTDIDGGPVIIIFDDDDEYPADDTPKGQVVIEPPEPTSKALCIKESHIKLSDLYSGKSENALTPHETRNTWRAICEFATQRISTPRDSDNTTLLSIAVQLVIISGLIGKRPDQIIYSLSKHKSDEDDYGLDGEVKGTVVTLKHKHFFKCPDLPGSVPIKEGAQQRALQEIELNLKDIPFFNSAHLDLLTSIDPNEDEQTEVIHQYISEITSLCRESCKRFSIYRWTYSIAQQIFTQTYDLPLIQLLFNEKFSNHGIALHYIAYSTEMIHEQLCRAQETLFGQAYSINLRKDYIGAPRGMTSEKIFSVIPLSKPQKIQNNIPLDEMYTLQNEWCDYISQLIAISTVSRSHADFEDLTLKQISLEIGLVIYEDKPTDPAHFRRIAVLCDFVLFEIEAYLAQLSKLRRQLRQHGYAIHQHIQRIFEGSEPLFFNIRTDGNTPEIAHWDKSLTFKRFYPEGTPSNIYRHIFSTTARELYPEKAHWIEHQLGHIFPINTFNSESVISPLEMRGELNDILHNYLSRIGFDVGNKRIKSLSRHPSLLNIKDIFAFHQSRLTKDRELVRARYLGDKTDYPVNYLNILESHITRHVEIASIKEIPPQTDIPDDVIHEAYQQYLSQLPSTPSAINSGNRKFRHSVKRLNHRYNLKLTIPQAAYWQIPDPIDFDCSNLPAFELIQALRQAWLTKFVEAPCSQGMLIGLTLFNAAATLEEAIDICTNKQSVCYDRSFKKLMGKKTHTTEESIVLSGIPAMIIARNKYDHIEDQRTLRTLLKKYISSLINIRVTLEDFEAVLKLARQVEMPPIFHQLFHGDQISKDLSVGRMNDLMTNSVASKCYANTEGMLTRTSLPPTKGLDETGQKWQIKALSTKILKDRNEVISRERIQKRIQVFIKRQDLCDVAYFSAHWALDLLGPHANLKNGKTLKTQTVKDYVNLVARGLIEGLDADGLIDNDPESIKLQLEDLIRDRQILNRQEKREAVDTLPHLLNRFFSFINNEYDMGFIYIQHADEKNDDAINIRADYITPKEYEAILKIFEVTAFTRKLTPSQYSLLQGIQLMHTLGRYGLRTREASMLPRNHFPSTNDPTLAIRKHQRRGLKTRRAERTVFCDAASIPFKFDRTYLLDEMDFKSNEFRVLYPLLHEPIRYFTGEPQYRYYSHRHTYATNTALEMLPIKDGLKKIQLTSNLKREMGHLDLRTTFGNYVHVHALLRSSFCQIDLSRFQQKELARLFGVSEAALSKNPIGNLSNIPPRYVTEIKKAHSHKQKPPFNTEAYTQIDNSDDLHKLASFIDLVNKSHHSLVLEHLDALGDIRIVAKRLREIQIRYHWELLPMNFLEKLAGTEEKDLYEFQHQITKPRQIDTNYLTHWQKSLEKIDKNKRELQLRRFLDHAAYIDIGERHCTFSPISSETLTELQEIFTTLIPDLRLLPSSNEKSVFDLVIKAPNVSRPKQMTKVLLVLIELIAG